MPRLPRPSLASFALPILCAILLFVSPSFAQTAGTASIQGTITDSTGAAISGAKVIAVNIATQVTKTTVSGGNGLYSFPNLSVGTYSLEVAENGFRTYSRTNIVLEVGSSIAINVPMAIGETTQRVEVEATGLALQTEDPSFKQTIDEKTVTELPLNGRQVTSLILRQVRATLASG